MEAKDTVIGKNPFSAESCSDEAGRHFDWQAGYRAGIREVVEWIKENRTTPFGVDAYGYYIWENKLQAKLKEWGL